MTHSPPRDPVTTPPDADANDVTLDDLRRDLTGEQNELDAVVSAASEEAFYRSTPSPGWDVFDQIAHLAYFDDRAAVALEAPDDFDASVVELVAHLDDLDDFTLGNLRKLTPASLVIEWRNSRERLSKGAARLDPSRRVAWYGPSMSAHSFLRARLMETWAHGADVASALGVRRIPTARLLHVAQLGYLTRPWSYRVRGEPVPPGSVRVELRGPHDEAWHFGPAHVEDVVVGSAEEFCLVVTQRRHVDDTDLRCGDLGRDWLVRAQAFAGGASDGPGRTT